MMLLNFFLFFTLTQSCVQTELIDDIIDVIVRNSASDMPHKRSGTNDDQGPPGNNLPWAAKHSTRTIADLTENISNNNVPAYVQRGHPGYRGGKKREMESTSLLNPGYRGGKKREMELASLLNLLDSERQSSKKSATISRREKAVKTLIEHLLADDSKGKGGEAPANLPWKRSSGALAAPNLPWKKSAGSENTQAVPNLPWKKRTVEETLKKKPANLPWKRKVEEGAEEAKEGNNVFKRLVKNLKDEIEKTSNDVTKREMYSYALSELLV